MSGFRTKIDLGDNRQGIQRVRTITDLSGTTVFGTEFSALTSGVDLTTVITTSSLPGITSTFSGNSSVTNISFGDSRMVVASSSLDAITSGTSGTTQVALGFEGKDFTIIDGNTVYSNYTGSTYDIFVTTIEEVATDTWTGETYSDVVLILSGDSLDYTERPIWVDVLGITKTDKLILDDEPETITGVTKVLVRDIDGNVVQSDVNGDKTYRHNQGTPASVWNVTHNLEKYPSIMILNGANEVVEGHILYVDTNNVTLTFNGAFSGDAIFN